MTTAPQVIILAEPNGVGKSTAAAHSLPESMEFVNADEVAKTLPGYPSQAADLLAARLVLAKMDGLEQARADFAVETTLASRSLAPRLARLVHSGYQARLLFLFVPTVELSIQRVACRVLLAGHSIPEATIRRRYEAGIRNFFELYQPLVHSWSVFDTMEIGPPKLIASGVKDRVSQLVDPVSWHLLQERDRHE